MTDVPKITPLKPPEKTKSKLNQPHCHFCQTSQKQQANIVRDYEELHALLSHHSTEHSFSLKICFKSISNSSCEKLQTFINIF